MAIMPKMGRGCRDTGEIDEIRGLGQIPSPAPVMRKSLGDGGTRASHAPFAASLLTMAAFGTHALAHVCRNLAGVRGKIFKVKKLSPAVLNSQFAESSTRDPFSSTPGVTSLEARD